MHRRTGRRSSEACRPTFSSAREESRSARTISSAAFGVRDGTLVFGLPGNPVSSLVSVELFVRPALAALQGAEPGPHYERAVLTTPLRRNGARDELVRARTSFDGDETIVTPLSGQESHMIVRAATADALVHVPAGEGELATGTRVRILRLG